MAILGWILLGAALASVVALLLRRRASPDLDFVRDGARAKAEIDARLAAVDREVVADHVVLQGEPKGQAARAAAASGASEHADVLAGDLQRQADEIAEIIGTGTNGTKP